MRGKAVTTSAMVLLLECLPTLDDVANCLAGFPVTGQRRGPVVDPRGRPGEWPLAGPGFVVAFRPEVRGEVYVDVIDRRWPEELGSTTRNPSLHRAWLMGRFGPFSYPDGLQRAVEQARWDEADAAVTRHSVFIRLCSTYGDSWRSGVPTIPADYEPIQELEFMTELAAALSSVSSAVAYFNPSGEVLCSPDELRDTWHRSRAAGEKPLSLWCGARHFPPHVTEPLALCDTNGLRQLDRLDVEVHFRAVWHNPHEISAFCFALATTAIENGDDAADGEVVRGPGGMSWQGQRAQSSTIAPERPVVRWLPTSVDTPRRGKAPSREAGADVERSIQVAVRRVLELLVQGDYPSLEKLTGGQGLPIAYVRSAVEEYGYTLCVPPDDALEELVDVYPSYSQNQPRGEPRSWSIDVDLWTEEKGRSDLTLQLELTLSESEMSALVITDLHVL